MLSVNNQNMMNAGLVLISITSQHVQTESKSATTLEPTPGSACKTVMIKSAQNLHSRDKTLLPECETPFPRAPPRKTRSANNKRRKCGILTDSSEKAAIEQHTEFGVSMKTSAFREWLSNREVISEISIYFTIKSKEQQGMVLTNIALIS